jgi:hypothetical protein
MWIFYELKNQKCKQPVNILENGFFIKGRRISSPFKIVMPDIWASLVPNAEYYFARKNAMETVPLTVTNLAA